MLAAKQDKLKPVIQFSKSLRQPNEVMTLQKEMMCVDLSRLHRRTWLSDSYT